MNMPIRMTPVIHHAEHLAHIPYRYIKVFKHKIKCTEESRGEEKYFCLNVIHEDKKDSIERDFGEKVWIKGRLSEETKIFGEGNIRIEAIPLSIYVDRAVEVLTSDPSSWLNPLV